LNIEVFQNDQFFIKFSTQLSKKLIVNSKPFNYIMGTKTGGNKITTIFEMGKKDLLNIFL